MKKKLFNNLNPINLLFSNGILFEEVTIEQLENIETVCDKVLQTKSAFVSTDYNVVSKSLTVKGNALDLFLFGYYLKDFEDA